MPQSPSKPGHAPASTPAPPPQAGGDALARFVVEHAMDDTAALLLARHRHPDIDMDLAVLAIEARRKTRAKLPTFHAQPRIVYPTRLCTEQCSSEASASYKAHLAASILAENSGGRDRPATVADLTGGLGVDTLYFSRVADMVYYNEMDEFLARHVKENLALLGADNVSVSSLKLEPGTLGRTLGEVFGDAAPGLIYLDPARRSATGRKVFRLEDCSPDITLLHRPLLDFCPHLLLKLSPMADPTLLKSALPNLESLHVVQVHGECKELLLHLDRSYGAPDYRLVVVEIGQDGSTGQDGGDRPYEYHRMEFRSTSEKSGAGRFVEDTDLAGRILFEPGAALSKAGLFATLSRECGLLKLAPSTHLYTAEDAASSLGHFGKFYRIAEAEPMSKAALRGIASRYPELEVSARNVPLSSDELRKRLRVRSGPDAPHLFACAVQPSGGTAKENYLLVCRNL